MSKIPFSPKHFAMLCEHVLLEYSATAAQLGTNNPYIKDIAVYLHKKYALPNDFEGWQQISMPFKWGELMTPYPSPTPGSKNIEKKYQANLINRNSKNRNSKKKLLIMGGKNGAAAILIGDDNYEVLIKTAEPEHVYHSYSGGSGNAALANVKDAIGKPTEIYLGRYQSSPSRKTIASTPTGISSSQDEVKSYLFKKFEPLLDKAIQKAVAELKSMATTQIKHDADVDKITKKLKQIKQLNQVLEEPAGKEKFLGTYLYNAILATASHYYPNETGNITARYGGNLSPQDSKGMYQVQQDIANKDMEKIASVLYYLRQGLMR